MNILAIIPARSGSKSVVDKNIRPINGKPMLAYSIEHALKSKYINRVIVSTDSEKYAEIAKKYGAEVPFIRPAQLATDTSLDYDVFLHALQYLKETEDYEAEIVVQLRPTYPIREVDDIDEMIRKLIDNPSADSIRCVAPAGEIAYKMWRINEDSTMTPLLNDIPEAYNMPRQALPQIYYQNACIDVFRSSTVLEKHSMSGDCILSYIMNHNYDIDTEAEFKKASNNLRIKEGNSRYNIDIDSLLCESCNNPDSNKLTDIIKRLYSDGKYIILNADKDKYESEEIQIKHILNEKNIFYNELIFEKRHTDFFISDKSLSVDEVYNELIPHL